MKSHITLIERIKRRLMRYFSDLSGRFLALLTSLYLIIGWLLLRLVGEVELSALPDYFYWAMVTASTVGYGDLSPQTDSGKWLVSLYFIPLGLSLFGLLIGHLAAWMAHRWQQRIRGYRSLTMNNHILVIGWRDSQTLQLIRLLLREQRGEVQPKRVVLCVEQEMDNPLIDEIDFVRVGSFTGDDMQRCNLADAATVVIDTGDDNQTLACGLYCASVNEQAHLLVNFTNPSLGALLKKHCSNVEAMPTLAVEMLAKAAADPGSTYLHHQLLNVNQGMTQYSHQLVNNIHCAELFTQLKQSYDATLIAVGDGKTMQLNPSLELELKAGQRIFYIADERINDLRL